MSQPVLPATLERSLRHAQPLLEPRLHLRPVVVDHRVPGRVTPLAAAHELVLTRDALERRAHLLERGTRALVQGVGLELDAEVPVVLGRVRQEEVLRLGVRVRPPGARVEPRVPDLDHAVFRPVVEEARVPDQVPVEVMGESQVHRRPPAAVLVAVVTVEAHPAPGARILRHLPQLLLLPRLERLEPDALPLEGYVKRQPSPSENERRMRRATTALCTSSGPSEIRPPR